MRRTPYLERNWDGSPITVQIFLEPKGCHMLANDDWKGHFLVSIENQARLAKLGGKNYKVMGLPLFNESDWPSARAFREGIAAYRM